MASLFHFQCIIVVCGFIVSVHNCSMWFCCFSGKEGRKQCEACKPGTFADVPGSPKCKDCPKGMLTHLSVIVKGPVHQLVKLKDFPQGTLPHQV